MHPFVALTFGNLKAVRRLIKEELATEVKVIECSDETICEHCTKMKLTQPKLLESKRRAKEPIRLIHSDICGSMQTATPSGKKYFLTLIDDYSRFTVTRLLKTKTEVPGVASTLLQCQ